MHLRRLASAALVSLGVLGAPSIADAFCGFYVGGADTKLFNDATMVVMMREGTRTVLSMQNAYKGPPEKFAMVVPVPVVLKEENVKTLPRDLFDKVDQLAAPRLVEYWEQDPCYVPPPMEPMMAAPTMAAAPAAKGGGADKDYGVKVEAQFTVGEYQVVVLSASDSGGLEAWLHKEKYTIPDGAAPYFKPYIASGSKFFVAKVDITKVTMENGVALLSPLRFHYDADSFSLPVRLGLINSSGTQDLIVHVLARGKRYEVANYPNVTIPTNLDVSEKAKNEFGAFYTTLFDKTLEKNPKAVVTEYSWDAGSCDPCPGPSLDMHDLATLGGDVLVSAPPPPPPPPPPPVAPKKNPNCDPPFTIGPDGRKKYKMDCLDEQPARPVPPPPMRPSFFGGGGFTITRLHARYTKETLGQDLVFKEAPAIMGGREVRGADGKLETGAKTQNASMNNFQARYAVRHPWTGPITCKEPRRGIWGGPRAGGNQSPIKAAKKIGLAPRTAKVELASFVKQDIPELAIAKIAAPEDSAAPEVAPQATTSASMPAADPSVAAAASAAANPATPGEPKKGCAGCAVVPQDRTSTLAALLGALGITAMWRARRRR